MNVVTANQNKEIIDRLDIDIIKRIDGEYELRELLGKFVNLYFNKMIIDITSIKNYKDIKIIEELAKVVDPSRVILLLNNDPELNTPLYMSTLINCGFYNFTRNFEGIKFLYNTPNTYENVKHLMLSDAEQKAQMGAYIASQNVVFKEIKRQVIGLQNISVHAGSTSLVNMMVRQLRDNGINAVGIEMFKQDLIFYHEKFLFSCMNRQDLENKLRELTDCEAVIIDLNEFGEADKYCDEILYIIEPSYVKLTKMIKKNRNVLIEHKDDKILLNMSFVNNQEVPDFEYETKLKIFDNLPPLNDRNRNLPEINGLLGKLGFILNSSNNVNNV